MGAAALTVVLLFLVPDLETESSPTSRQTGSISSWHLLRAHHRLFLTLGTAIVMVGIVRGARSTVLPLWAEHLGQIQTLHPDFFVGVRQNGVVMGLDFDHPEGAKVLNVAPRTVAFHKYRMMEQLKVKSTAELVQYAVKQHIV